MLFAAKQVCHDKKQSWLFDFSVFTMDESTDMTDTVPLMVFIYGTDSAKALQLAQRYSCK